MKPLLAILLLCFAVAAFAAGPPAAKPAEQPLLPKAFAGWEQSAAKASADAAEADPANAAVLKEYGFQDFQSATYTKPGRTLKLRAARFQTRSGAYGAFTFYKQPQMITEQIGDQASAGNEHVLFYRGNVLVEAAFDRTTAMSAAELRELSDLLPIATGEAQGQPPLLEYFPRQAYVKNSVKYVLGPAGLNAIGAPVTAEVVDFSKAPEIATARYSSSAGEATLTLIYYPTPQIATQQLRAIETQQASSQHSERDNFASKRTGPLVALVTGAIPTGEAKSLLASVNYEAEVTWNEKTKLTLKDNPVNLVWAAMQLAAFLTGLMFAFAILYVAARFAMRRYWPQRARNQEMIRLDIEPLAGVTEGDRPALPNTSAK